MKNYEFRVVKGWTVAGTMEKIQDHQKKGWELVTTYPRFVSLFPLVLLGEMFGLVGVMRKEATIEEEWSPNTGKEHTR
jgi:hypothetical protein